MEISLYFDKSSNFELRALVTPIYDSMDPYVATTHTFLSRVFLVSSLYILYLYIYMM